MKLIIEIDFEQAMKDCIDPPQNEWSLGDFEDDFIENLKEKMNELQTITGASINIRDEDARYIY